MTPTNLRRCINHAISDAIGVSRSVSPRGRGDIDDIDGIAEAVLEALSRTGSIRPFVATHRHKVRGTSYQRVATGIVQTAVPLTDMQHVIIYRGTDGQHWVRPASEFDDGRFEVLP